MPRSASESVSDEEHLDENWSCEGNKGCNGCDTEDGSDGDLSSENKESQDDANDRIEPHCVDRGLSVFVDLLNKFRAGEDIVPRVSVRNYLWSV
jgi:hypothetical protein